MIVPAEAAVITNGRPYVGLVAAVAVAVRVAKLSPSINDDAFQKEREKRVPEKVACLASPPTEIPNASVIARLSRGFLPHRQFGFSLLEAGRSPCGSCPGYAGLSLSAPSPPCSS